MTDDADHEAALVWGAALVLDVDPGVVLEATDVGALSAVTAEVAAAGAPLTAAATLLAGVIDRRPFPTANSAIGWLAAVELLSRSGRRVEVAAPDVVELCRAIRSARLDIDAIANAMRRWVIEPGIPCPACCRRVYAGDELARRLAMPGASRFEIVARCAYEHGAHDRRGDRRRPTQPEPVESSQPVLARGTCGSMLVGGDRMLVLAPHCDDPVVYRVAVVGELSAGDLVGRWDRLVERSETIGFVLAEDVRAGLRADTIDTTHLHLAIRRVEAAA